MESIPPKLCSEPHAPGVESLAQSGPGESSRYHSLDALRAVALFLGIFLHAGLAYLPINAAHWAILDRSGSVLIGAAVLVVHSFRLEVFFLMAGFFARLIWKRLGPRGFAANRALRVMMPFALGWAIVLPLLAYDWIWGATKSAALQSGQPLPSKLGPLPAALATPFQVGILDPNLPLTHLWFLYYLTLVYAVFLGLRAASVGVWDRIGRFRAWIDRNFKSLLESRWTLVILSAVTWVILQGMNGLDVDTPDRGLRPHYPALALYGLFFSVGWLLHRQPSLLALLRDRWLTHFIAAVCFSLGALTLIDYASRPSPDPPVLVRSAYRLVYGGMMWSWVLALTGAFQRFCESESRLWRYLSDSSYWLYIIHLPIVVWLQVAFAHLPYSCWVKFSLVLAVSVPVLLVSYHLLVRSTPIGWLLNGRRHPFRFFA